MASKKTRVTMKDKGWNRFRRTLLSVEREKVVVGIPGAPNFETMNMPAIGMVHEFGTVDGVIPERSFLRFTFDKNKSKYKRLLSQYAKASLRKRAPKQRSLFMVGETARGDVVNSIRNRLIKQDLQPATIARKKGDTAALIDHGDLIGSIVSKLVKG